jgi:hypothetical protein
MDMQLRRDSFQRKVSAMRRMVLALDRQVQADSITEKELAKRWVSLWGAIAGVRRFPLEKPGRLQEALDNPATTKADPNLVTLAD